MEAFEYPLGPHLRRHGPEGYEDYHSYRDWLRDEFTFRCVYCLHREQWYDRGGTFHVEHVRPTKDYPEGKREYTNLVYACSACNSFKGNVVGIPDPCKVSLRECLSICEDGNVRPLNKHGKKLVGALKLNSRSNVRCRLLMMQVIAMLKEKEPALYLKYMGFPEDLPDLRPPKKRVPRNSKPEGAENCFYALRERGELPETY